MRKRQWLPITTLCLIVGITNAQDLNPNNDRFFTTERNQYYPSEAYTPDPYRPPQSSRNDQFGPPDQRNPYGKSDQYGNNEPFGRNDPKFDNRPMYRPYDDGNPNYLDNYPYNSIIKEASVY